MSIHLISHLSLQNSCVQIIPPFPCRVIDEINIYSAINENSNNYFVQIVLQDGDVKVYKNKIIIEGSQKYKIASQFWEFIIRDIYLTDYFKSKMILNDHLVIIKGDPIDCYLISHEDKTDDWDILKTTLDRYKKMKALW